jgi:hypothetical protein
MSDADWASCTRTQRSFTGSLIKLAGTVVAYKTKLQDTISTLSLESEFMAAYDLAKMLLYVCSIMWDLKVPQEVASKLCKDNNACTAMANTHKPMTHTWHMDIRYNVLCEWVKQDLFILERVDTNINEANHFTKILAWVLFHQHINYIMGHVPPEYSPTHLQSTGQFDTTKLQTVPNTFTTKQTMTLPISLDIRNKSYPIAVAAARLYTPDYSALIDNPWTRIIACTE